MSDIIITEKNLSRFIKRLKNTLEQDLQIQVSHNKASLLLAKTFGVDSLHHLQQKLAKVHSYDSNNLRNNHSNLVHLEECGECIHYFVLVDTHFFEKQGAPFAFHNDIFCHIHLENHEAYFFDTFEDAIKNVKQEYSIINYYHPLNQDKLKGFGNFYTYQNENNETVLTTMNAQFKHTFKSVADYHLFLEKMVPEHH